MDSYTMDVEARLRECGPKNSHDACCIAQAVLRIGSAAPESGPAKTVLRRCRAAAAGRNPASRPAASFRFQAPARSPSRHGDDTRKNRYSRPYCLILRHSVVRGMSRIFEARPLL
jgi:hypothetical protein